MSILVIGKTQDPWSKNILQNCPPNAGRKILLLPSRFGQMLLTLPGKIFGYRVIWLADNNDVPKIYARLAKLAKYIITPNQAAEVRYLKIGVPSAKIKTIYPAVRLSEKIIFPPIASFTIACDSRVDINNGLGTLLKATALAKDILGNIKLIIAGPIKNRSQIEWSCRSLGLGGRVQFAPGENDIWIEEVHAYIIPTATAATLPIFLLQAMGLGRAVIATDKLEHKEFIKDKERGLLIEPNNAEVLSQAIITLARDKELLARLGEANHRFIGERQIAMANLYREILEN